MATKQGGLLVTLGKRLLGFNSSSSGCCATPQATSETDTPDATAAADTPAGGCCASADAANTATPAAKS